MNVIQYESILDKTKDGSGQVYFLKTGELPAGTKRVAIACVPAIGEPATPRGNYSPEVAAGIIENAYKAGQNRYAGYMIVPICGKKDT